MTKLKSQWVSIWCVALLGLTGCGGSSTKSPTTTESPVSSQTCVGADLLAEASCLTFQNRESVVFKPEGKIEGIALFLHGAPGHPNKVMQIFDGKMLATKMSWLSVAPQGTGGTWGWSSLNNGNDNSNVDVDFISALIDELKAQYNVSSDSVYIFGYSAGGFMGYKLACQIPEKLTSIISLAGQYRGDFNNCTTATSVALHHFHSPSDTDVPMSGRTFGGIQSVENTLNHRKQINGCDVIYTETDDAGVTSTSSGTTTKLWNNCVKPIRFSQMMNVNHEDNYQSEALYEIYKASL